MTAPKEVFTVVLNESDCAVIYAALAWYAVSGRVEAPRVLERLGLQFAALAPPEKKEKALRRKGVVR